MQNKETEKTPQRPVPEGKKVIDMRNVFDPEVEEAVKEILEAEWDPAGVAFDHEVSDS